MIKSVSNNTFTSIKGDARHLFSMVPVDKEQMSVSDIQKRIDLTKRELNKLPSSKKASGKTSLYKFYYLNSKMYIEDHDKNGSFKYLKNSPAQDCLHEFIGGDNFYSDAVFKDDYLKLNGKYFRFVSINFEDDHLIDVSTLQEFGNYFICFERIETMFSKMKVDSARKVSHSSLYKVLSDIEGIEKYRENETLLKKIINREEELFKVEINFVIQCETEVELQVRTVELIENLERQGLSPKIESTALNVIFKNYCPGVNPTLQKGQLFHTSLLANTISFHKSALMGDGVHFLSHSNEPLFLNTRKGINFNLVVTGASGGGKTMTMQKILSHSFEKGNSQLIIDPKEDYLKYALLNNAYIIEDSINPMIFKDAKYFRNLILSRVPKNERTEKWSGKLLSAIRETNAHEEDDFFKAIDSLSKKGFSDLEYYFEDIRENITNRPIDLNRMVYFQIGSFQNETIPFLLSFAFQYVEKFNTAFDLVVDEAHKVFRHDPVFLEEKVRMMRVKNGSLVTISQGHDDFMNPDNKFGQVVYNNSFHKIYFPQDITHKTGLNQFDLGRIGGIEEPRGRYREFYYKSEVHQKIVKYAPTNKEMELFRSDNPKENTKKMLRYIKDMSKYFTTDEAVNQWVRDKYASKELGGLYA